MKPHARVRRLALSIVAAGALAVQPVVAGPASATTAGFGRHRVAGGLNNPAAFTFAPSGRIFYGERGTGEIHVYTPAQHTNHLFFTVQHVVSEGERGLLGIALHPNFPSTPLVYAFATRIVSGHHESQILRITDSGGHGTNPTVIFRTRVVSSDSNPYHNGGRILFGPDGMLYAIVGEAHDSANAQNRTNPAGKILRMTPAGKPAPGNPFIGSPTRDRRIWAFGIRNSFGFTFDPQTKRLWETENGPECNDELNRIVKGGNYGWGPFENCGGSSPGDTNNSGPRPRIRPKLWYTPTIAPTGAVFCQGCRLGPHSSGRLFFGDFNTSRIRRVTLGSSRLGVIAQAVIYHHSDNVLSMERGPSGGIYFSDDHAIYKLVRT